MDVDNIVKELGNQLGLDNLALDENNVCRIVFDEKFNVDIEAMPDKKSFFIHAVLCRVPAEHKEVLFAELLEANLFGKGTGGASFGYDANLGEVLLFRRFETEKTDYPEFEAAVEEFLNYMESWSKRIESGEAGEGPSSREPGMAPGEPFIRA